MLNDVLPCFFILSFNFSETELCKGFEEQFKKMANHVLGLSEAQLNILIANGQIEEVESNDDTVST